MSSSADTRLQRLIGGEQFASLRSRLRRPFERAPLDATIESFRIGKLTREEHAALASLLGRPPHYSSSLQIDLRALDTSFRNSGVAASLRDALEQLDGPIVHLATTRLRLEALWSNAVDGCTHPELIEMLHVTSGIGLLKRLSKQRPSTAARLCREAEAVLQHLPAKGVARSQLAADTLGDAHALDSGQAVATLVLTVWRRVLQPTNEDRGEENDDVARTESSDAADLQQASGKERDRDIWAKAGVLVNELARPALFLNLPIRGAESRGRSPGEPTYMSLRSLLRSPPAWHVGGMQVYVCENPNLLAIAADRWGPDCAPLVCTDGMPAAAQRSLLSQLAQARARLCYHGDFDWPGLRIGNHVMRTYDAEPWCFKAADYAAAVRQAPSHRLTLSGKPVDALWDGELSKLMQQHRVAIAEEGLAGSLLHDLGAR